MPERRYELAGRLLAQAVAASQASGIPAAEALGEAARRQGRDLGAMVARRVGADRGTTALVDAACALLEDSGYEPRRDEAGVTLSNCPFGSLAEEHASLICGMNLALMAGLVAALGTDELEATLDPAPGRCCVRLRTA
jgi:predicted ArsR family transcriptional regulator